ncbi:hybrid sensor histidine kinase/response regulator transcription factor [Parabacteroides pacaensis]|uniref:hybrid sensor histidine kinase/response regulator transcription factor n=1 Tax=Parabacteroides pacaensis TaxID=2086575 RepID=UPI000D0F7ACE|nr:response regulator [Parabacteroides pacaensis]
MNHININKKLLFVLLYLGTLSTSIYATTSSAPNTDKEILPWLIAGLLLIGILFAIWYIISLKKQNSSLHKEKSGLLDVQQQYIKSIQEKEKSQQLISSLTTEKATLEQTLTQKVQETEEILKETKIREQEAETKLHEVEQIHSTFFTYTVHEMRTPLSLVLGTLSQLTQNTNFNSETSAQLLSAYRNSLALQDLADQLIDTRHASTVSKHLRIARYNIVDITKQICDLFVDWIAMNKIEFTLSTDNPALWVWIDRRKMEYSLRMLLSNSFQNTYLYGKISVDISVKKIEDKGYCVIAVQDDGLNENESTRRGLLQIENMVQDLGGKFQHQNNESESKTEGTAYNMYIPLGKLHLLDKAVEFVEPEGDLVKLNDIQKEEIAELIRITSEKGQSGKKLLVVDDNDQIRWFLKHIFSNEYQILEARNGQEGIDLALKEQPNIILCDVMMPVKDGFEVCKEIKTNPKTFQTPVIMLTAKVESEDVIAGIETGADDYITKPFDVEILKSKIRHLLKRREQLKQYFTRSLLATDLSGNQTDNSNNIITKSDNAFMDSVIKIIEKYLDDPKFEAKVLADELYMSLPTLYRKIKQHSDCSILELTRTVRLKKAAELILTQRYSIQEVSEMVGFNDTATFRKRFTEQFGVTPSAYGQTRR